jgi:hypothetical protein
MHDFLQKFFSLSFVAGSVFLGTGCAEVSGGEAETVAATDAAVAASNWFGWQVVGTNANGFEGSPAVAMAGPDEAVLVGRDKVTNRFRVTVAISVGWSDLGTKTFIAKPAVAALDGFFGTPEFLRSYQFAVVGIASDNQYHIRIGQLQRTTSPTSNPTLVPGRDWTVIPNSTYASPPAVTVHSGSLIVLGRKSNNTLVLHNSVLAITMQSDFFTNVWGATAAVPALPSGWVAQGDPAIASLGDANSRVIIVTRAVNNGQKRLYANPWDRTSFFGWVSIPLTGVDLSGEPAVEYGLTLNKATVYVKGSDSRIYQSSGLNSSWEAFTPLGNETFASNPAAVGSLGSVQHLVVAGKSNNQFSANLTQIGAP